MPRHKNPWATFVIFLCVVGFAWASWHFLHEKKLFRSEHVATQPPAEIERLKKLLTDTLADDECFDGLASFNWRDNSHRYRIDILMRDGCEKERAKMLVRRVADLVKRATDGIESEVSCLVLGREVYHYVP